LIGHNGASDHVEESGLASPVRADNGEQVASRYSEADAIYGEEAAKAFADAFKRKQRGHCRHPDTPIRGASQGHTPSGRATTTSSRQMP
jgi:hypothetical protein